MKTESKDTAKPGKNLKELLFDKKFTSPIPLVNGQGKEICFGQVYATVIGGTAYCILSPLAAIKGMSAKSAFVFEVTDDNTLRAVPDEKAEKVFSEYYGALKSQSGGSRNNG